LERLNHGKTNYNHHRKYRDTIGSELVDLLSKSGATVRAVMRNISRVREIPRVVWMQADVSDASLLDGI